jgi:hypothetical protein
MKTFMIFFCVNAFELTNSCLYLRHYAAIKLSLFRWVPMVLREPINICNTEAAVGYPEGERDLKSLEPATLKPLAGRQFLMKDLQQMHRTLGFRYRQLITKVTLPKSFNFTAYSTRDLVDDIHSVQKQLGDAVPQLNQLIRLMKLEHGNINTTCNFHKDDKSTGDFYKLKNFARMLVCSEVVLNDADVLSSSL